MATQPPDQDQGRQNTQQRQREAENPRYNEQPPRQQEQTKSEEQTKSQEQTRSEPQPARQTQQVTDISEQVQTGKKLGFKTGEAKIALGRAGEHHLAIQWIDVPLENCQSARFNVTTSPGNALEVQMLQNAYKKTYSGTGSVSTQVLPAAPKGTRGKMTVRDTTSGETLEQDWVWYELGGWGKTPGPGLWETIKRLIWKSES
jgi:hypothetical protein